MESTNDPSKYAPNLFAAFTTHRTFLNQKSGNSPRIWVDTSVFRDGKNYLIGTLDIPSTGSPTSKAVATMTTDGLSISGPAPSKLLMYLSLFRPDVPLPNDVRAAVKSMLDLYQKYCILDKIPAGLVVGDINAGKSQWSDDEEGASKSDDSDESREEIADDDPKLLRIMESLKGLDKALALARARGPPETHK